MSTVAQRSFAGGEIAPALYARVDTTKYATGLRTCRNGWVMRHGGYANRPGTQFIGEVNDSSKAVRLIDFVFNSAQTYVLEFGDLYMRVIRAGAYVTETEKTITGVSQASEAVVTSVAHGYSNGDEVYISGVLGMTQLNGRNFKVANVTANTFKIKYLDGTYVNSTAFTAYSSAGTAARIYTLVTTYAVADLPELQYVQSADVVTIVHPTYPPRELSRTGHASWSIADITFTPGIAAPGSVANSGAAGSTTEWVVTSVASETYEESVQSASTSTSATPSSGSPVNVTWAAVSGAQEYNVYKKRNGVYGFIGVAGSTSFSDTGLTADTTDTPPVSRNPFSASGDYPSTVSYIQQRRMFANTNNDPEKTWGSRIGMFSNFTISAPLQDDDAITFTIAGRQVNSVKHLLDLGKLVTFTTAGEWAIEGDTNGILKPGAINPKQYSYNGASSLRPLVIGGNALYVQARGSIVRDLGFDYQIDGYRGNDLTIFSAHLFEGYSLIDWCYQQIPHSIVWAVRDDGVLVGLTYVREHQLFAWHRHDFDGVVENVCTVSEGDEDFLYVCVKRTIDGRSVRYIERMNTRLVGDIQDSVFMDSALSYDGRNTGSQTMTLSGSGWTYTDTLTLTSSTSYFSAAEVGNAIHLTGSDGTIIRAEITGYTSATVVSVRPNITVPVSMRSVAITSWARAVDRVTGLWHLEGQDVSVFADGFVVASPNNESYVTVTVTDGAIDLDNTYSVIHVGLPYISDLETLDMDSLQGETLADKKKNVSRLSVHLESSRGIFAGPKPPTDDTVDPLEGLYELKIRSDEGYDDPVGLETGVADINIQSEWNSNGRIFIRQVDPVPMSVLAVAPAGKFPFKQFGGA